MNYLINYHGLKIIQNKLYGFETSQEVDSI
jgi:hypothetical protein